MQCIPRHLQLTIVESALCCPCLEPLFSLGSQTACTQCRFSTLPGVIVPGTGSQPSYTASSEQAPIHFTAENSISGTTVLYVSMYIVQCTYYNIYSVKNEISLGFQEFAPLSATKLEQVEVKVCMQKGTAARDLVSIFFYQ
jgi:hypothetical protein